MGADFWIVVRLAITYRANVEGEETNNVSTSTKTTITTGYVKLSRERGYYPNPTEYDSDDEIQNAILSDRYKECYRTEPKILATLFQNGNWTSERAEEKYAVLVGKHIDLGYVNNENVSEELGDDGMPKMDDDQLQHLRSLLVTVVKESVNEPRGEKRMDVKHEIKLCMCGVNTDATEHTEQCWSGRNVLAPFLPTTVKAGKRVRIETLLVCREPDGGALNEDAVRIADEMLGSATLDPNRLVQEIVTCGTFDETQFELMRSCFKQGGDIHRSYLKSEYGHVMYALEAIPYHLGRDAPEFDIKWRLRAFRFLLEEGGAADSAIINSRQWAGGWTLLGSICQVEGCDDDGNDNAASFNIEVAKMLIHHGADVNMAAMFEGRTPLMEASSYGYELELTKILIQAGADVNKTDTKGRTALAHVFISSSKYKKAERLRIINVLLDAGADGGHGSVVSEMTRHRRPDYEDIDDEDYDSNVILELAMLVLVQLPRIPDLRPFVKGRIDLLPFMLDHYPDLWTLHGRELAAASPIAVYEYVQRLRERNVYWREASHADINSPETSLIASYI